MFERYTEEARRWIFFSREEALKAGSDYIEPEHLFLGLLRADPELLPHLVPEGVERDAIYREVQTLIPEREAKTSLKDIRFAHPSKRVLAYGAEEAKRMRSRMIGTEHNFLGLFRESSAVSRILEKHGLILEVVRRQIRESL